MVHVAFDANYCVIPFFFVKELKYSKLMCHILLIVHCLTNSPLGLMWDCCQAKECELAQQNIIKRLPQLEQCSEP